MFQITFLQSSQGLKLKMRSPFILKREGHFVRLKQVFSKYKRELDAWVSGYSIFY